MIDLNIEEEAARIIFFQDVLIIYLKKNILKRIIHTRIILDLEKSIQKAKKKLKYKVLEREKSEGSEWVKN